MSFKDLAISSTSNEEKLDYSQFEKRVYLDKALKNNEGGLIFVSSYEQKKHASFVLIPQYPEKFAAALLVGGQWDPKAMETIADKNIWIIVAEGDTKAFPGMTRYKTI